MANRVSIHLAGREIVADDAQTILDVARANGVFIPTLCHFAGLSSVGACRLCVVEIRGVSRLATACTTYVRDGMEITVDSPRLAGYRRTLVELLLAERNHVCAVCVANGACELQTLAQTLGVTHTRYAYRYPKYAVDASHPRFVYDANRCVLCTRCVRVCAEVEGAHIWDVIYRSSVARVACDLDVPWGQAQSCTACGKCVRVCPTGALGEKGLAVGERRVHAVFLATLQAGRRHAR